VADEFPLKVGDTLSTAQLSLCAGGLIRTWTEDGPPRLWSIPDGQRLRSVQGAGAIARTLRADRRFRDIALLSADTATMFIPERPPPGGADASVEFKSYPFTLEPASAPANSTIEDVLAILTQAVRHCVSSDEFLVVEKGGWDALREPYCLFALAPQGDLVTNVIMTAPTPRGSSVWEPYIVDGQHDTTLTATATSDTIGIAPRIMFEAIATWGLAPWDLALTFAKYG
jgi:hypothetical protein